MDRDRHGAQPEDPSDVELLRRCAAAEEGALRLLFDRHAGRLGEYLYRLLGSREDAEEAVADVFVKAWRAARGYKGDASVRAWLYRIALHVAIDRMRSRRRAPSTVMPFADLDDHLVASVANEPEAAFFIAYQRERDRRALRRALQQLPPRDRALLALHYFEGCSYEQICEITGYPLARVKSRLHDARQRLKRHFVAARDSDEFLETQDPSTEEFGWDPKRLPVF